MRSVLAFVLALLFVPGAAAFSVETDPPADGVLDLGPIPYDLAPRIPVTVWVNCTLGDFALEGVRLSIGEAVETPLTVHAEPATQATDGPNACATEEDNVRFNANLTVAWTGVVDAREKFSREVEFQVAQSSSADSGSWVIEARQAFNPDIDVSLPDGFEYATAPDKAFAIPVRVFNGGNAPVRASVDVRVLGAYEPKYAHPPPPQVIDWADGRPQEARLVVEGHTRPAVGNVNQTIVLEIRVEVAPVGVEFAEFYTVRRLFIAHVKVVNQHLRPVDGGAAPDVGALFVGLAVVAAAALARYSLAGPPGRR